MGVAIGVLNGRKQEWSRYLYQLGSLTHICGLYLREEDDEKGLEMLFGGFQDVGHHEPKTTGTDGDLRGSIIGTCRMPNGQAASGEPTCASRKEQE